MCSRRRVIFQKPSLKTARVDAHVDVADDVHAEAEVEVEADDAHADAKRNASRNQIILDEIRSTTNEFCKERIEYRLRLSSSACWFASHFPGRSSLFEFGPVF